MIKTAVRQPKISWHMSSFNGYGTGLLRGNSHLPAYDRGSGERSKGLLGRKGTNPAQHYIARVGLVWTRPLTPTTPPGWSKTPPRKPPAPGKRLAPAWRGTEMAKLQRKLLVCEAYPTMQFFSEQPGCSE
jgi:hypothetical protein